MKNYPLNISLLSFLSLYILPFIPIYIEICSCFVFVFFHLKQYYELSFKKLGKHDPEEK